MAHGKVKLSVMVDVKTADEIDRMSKAWGISFCGTLRFMIKHYLRFEIKNLRDETMKKEKTIKNTTQKLIFHAKKRQWVLKEKTVNNATLIEILKETNVKKDQVINNLISDLVFSAHQVTLRDKTIRALKDMI